MEQTKQLLDEGRIDIALALSVSKPEPTRRLALNLILMHYLKAGDFSGALKTAGFLGRTLNNFELKIIARAMLAKKFTNFEGVKEVALKMPELDKTAILIIAFDKCLSSVIYDHSSNDNAENQIIGLASSMSEPTKQNCLNKLLEFSLRRFSYFDFAKKIIKSLGREFTQIELNKSFTDYFKEFAKRTDNYHSIFYELIEVIGLIGLIKKTAKAKLLKEKFLDLLLAECIRKKANDLLLFIADMLEEPKKTAVLNIIFNYYIATEAYLIKKEIKTVLKIAIKMSEPQKFVILNSFLEDGIQVASYEEVKEICQMMGRKPDENELFRIANHLINLKKYERAQEVILEIINHHSAEGLLKKVFDGFIELKHYGLALDTLKILSLKQDVSESAKLLFNKMMPTDKCLLESKDVALMMSDNEKPDAIRRFERRILKGGQGDYIECDYIIATFRTRGLDEKEFKLFLKGYASRVTEETEIIKLCLVLNPVQKSEYLKISSNRLTQLGKYNTVLSIIGRMTEVEQCRAYEKIRKVFVDLGMLDGAEMMVRITEIDLTDSELKIMLKKSDQEGLYDQARKIAKMLGTELSLVDLDVIMKKFIQEGKMNSAEEIAQIIISQNG